MYIQAVSQLCAANFAFWRVLRVIVETWLALAPRIGLRQRFDGREAQVCSDPGWPFCIKLVERQSTFCIGLRRHRCSWWEKPRDLLEFGRVEEMDAQDLSVRSIPDAWVIRVLFDLLCDGAAGANAQCWGPILGQMQMHNCVTRKVSDTLLYFIKCQLITVFWGGGSLLRLSPSDKIFSFEVRTCFHSGIPCIL